MNSEFQSAFDAGLGRQVGQALEGLDVFGAAIGISAVIDGIDAHEDVGRPDGLGKGQGQGEQHRVPRRDVGHRDAFRHGVGRPVLGHVQRVGQGAAAQLRQIDVEDHVPADIDRLGHAPRRLKLEVVPLAVVHRKRVEIVAFLPGDGGGGRRVEPPG